MKVKIMMDVIDTILEKIDAKLTKRHGEERRKEIAIIIAAEKLQTKNRENNLTEEERSEIPKELKALQERARELKKVSAYDINDILGKIESELNYREEKAIIIAAEKLQTKNRKNNLTEEERSEIPKELKALQERARELKKVSAYDIYDINDILGKIESELKYREGKNK